MATSGSVNFSTSRDEIIKYALLNLGVVGDGVTPSSTQVTTAAFYLNLLVKALQAKGMPMWALKPGYILPLHSVSSYSVGLSSTAHVVNSYTKTTLTAASIATDTTLDVDSISGISASDAIGIELDNGNIHWTTVSGSPSGSTVTIASGLATAAASGNNVFAYTPANRISKPLKIIHAFRRTVDGNTDVPIEVDTLTGYWNTPTKEEEGVPLKIFYDQNGVASSAQGNIYLWPRFQNGDYVIGFIYQRPFEDFDASTDEPDFPQEAFLSLVWGLSSLLTTVYQVPEDIKKTVLQQSQLFQKEFFDFNTEEGSIFIHPSTHG